MDRLRELAALLLERNQVDSRIAALINRPAERGHIGEFIARAVFGISEPESACHKGHDGCFVAGLLEGKTVNIKLYGKDEALWDVKPYPATDYYLVLCGDPPLQGSSKGTTRPLTISSIYLVPEAALRDAGVKPGIAASVRKNLRTSFRIYPDEGVSSVLKLSEEQRHILALFASSLR